MTLTEDQPMQASRLKKAMILTLYQPNQKRDRIIWRRPNTGPKAEKKQTDMMPRRLKKSTTRIASAKPRKKTGLARVPMAKEDMTMLAASHCAVRCQSCSPKKKALEVT